MTDRTDGGSPGTHVRPPGITRRATGSRSPRFMYLDAAGAPVTDPDVVARLEALAVPPAWHDVWMAPDPRARVQAVGVDGAGRTQYRYSPEWTRQRSQEKFAHVPEFARALPALRQRVAGDLAVSPAGPEPLGHDRVLAAAVRLLDLGFFRVGSERYARDNETYGLATLLRRHVGVEGDVVRFDYVAKEHLHRVVDVEDAAAAAVVRALLARDDAGEELLAWRSSTGSWHAVRSSHVNAYIHAASAVDATAKQFRTWAGTVLAAAALGGAEHGERGRSPGTTAVRATSRLLGNTPAVARASYVHPGVLAAFERGDPAADGVRAAVRAAADRLRDGRLTVVWRAPEVEEATIPLLG